MKVEELKDILCNLPSDAEVVVDDVCGNCIGLVSANYCHPILYLGAVEEFPQEWYDENGLEKNYELEKSHE